MEFAGVMDGFGTVGMEGVFGSEVDEEGGAGFGEPERIIVDGYDVGVHCWLNSVSACIEPATSIGRAGSMEDAHNVLRAVNEAKCICCCPGVEHLVPGLDGGSYDRWSLEDLLGSFVFCVPVLDGIAKEEVDTTKEHLPCGVQAGIVDVGENPNGRRIMPRKTDRSIERVWETTWLWRRGRD